MGEFVVYILKSGLYLALLFSIYMAVMSRQRRFAIMRVALIGICVASFLLPLIPALDFEVAKMDAAPSQGFAENIMAVETIQEINASETSDLWIKIIVGVVYAGMLPVGLITLVNTIRLLCLRRKGARMAIGGIELILFSDSDFSPFNFGRKIYMSLTDFRNNSEMVIAHEMAHISLGHRWDLVLVRALTILQWWNPMVWMLLRQIHAVHEFQADQAVLSEGYDKKEYQYLLIKKAAGSRLQTFADCLNHSKLKTRLTMMKNQNSRSGSRCMGLLMIPGAFVGLAIVSTPAVAALETEIGKVTMEPTSHTELRGKINEIIPEFQTSESLVSVFDAEEPGSDSKDRNEDSVSKNDRGNVDSAVTEVVDEKVEEEEESPTKKESGKPSIEIDGKLAGEDYDLNSLDPATIATMSVVKNDPNYPAGLIRIKTKKKGEDIGLNNASVSAVTVTNATIINYIGHTKKGTALVFQFPTSKEEQIKDVVWTIDGKDYSANSISSSFSRSGEEGYQTVRIELDKKIHTFKYGKDMIRYKKGNDEIERFIIPVDFPVIPGEIPAEGKF